MTNVYRCIRCEEPLYPNERLLCGECEHGRIESMWAAYDVSVYGHTLGISSDHQTPL